MGIKIPRISISVGGDREDKGASGSLSVLSIGYGLHQAWIYSAMFGADSIFDGSAQVSTMIGASSVSFSLAQIVFVISIIVFGLCLIIESFTDQKFLRFYVSKRLLAAAAILTSLGTFAVFATSHADVLGWAATIFAGTATGIGSSLLIIFWGTAYSRNDTASITINAALAITIAVAIYTVIFHWIPRPFSGIITALLPLIELPILWQLTPIPYSQRHELPIFNALKVKRAPFALRFGLPVLLFGVALGTLRAVSIQVVLPSSDITSLLLMWLAAGLASVITIAAILFAVAGARNSVGQWDMFFRALVPVIALAVVSLPFLGEGSILFNLILLIGYMCFEALMWIFFGELSQRFRLSPIMVFGLGRGVLALGSLIGTFIVSLTPGTEVLSSRMTGVIEWALFILVAIIIAYVLLPRQREIKSIVDPNSETENKAVEQLNKLAHDNTGNDSDDASEEAREAQKEEHTKGGRFRAQCETIANQYLLSRREAEVLFLLAKGHNAAFIQDKLYISRSTAKTHISHIYRKLDIHTQQELLAMMDEQKEVMAEGSEKAGETQ